MDNTMNRPSQYAVMGNPIAHSKSPKIHTLFAEQTGHDLVYDSKCVDLGQFEAAVRAFQAAGGHGLNVTVPFKQEAWKLVNEQSDRAERAGAVNTLRLDPSGSVYGDNTDGLGLVRDLTVNHNYQLMGRRVLILGAGGAARGILQPILAERPNYVYIANRTIDKAHELASTFKDLGLVSSGGFRELTGESFDLIINATAAGCLDNTVPPLPDNVLATGAWCYDLMYSCSCEQTIFVRWGVAQGAAKSVDGLGMLVEQAAESFYLWRGVRPQTAPVLQILRAA